MGAGDDLYVSTGGPGPATDVETGTGSSSDTTLDTSVDAPAPPLDAPATSTEAKPYTSPASSPPPVVSTNADTNKPIPSTALKNIGLKDVFVIKGTPTPSAPLAEVVSDTQDLKATHDAYKELLDGTPKSGPTVVEAYADLTEGKTVTFLNDKEETRKSMKGIVSGPDGSMDPADPGKGDLGDGPPITAGDVDPYTPPPSGETYAGAAPPTCDEPPFEYSQEPTCTPNPSAFVPDWTGLSLPVLNESNCQYNVPLQTTECPDGENIHTQVVGFAPEGIASLMQFLKKESTPVAESVLTAYINESEPEDSYAISSYAYQTDLSPSSNMKILYKWPFGLVRALRLGDAQFDPTGPTVGSFEIRSIGLLQKLDRLGRQLSLYASKQLESWAEQKIKIVIDGTLQEINLASEASEIDAFKASLNKLLLSNNYVLSNNGNRTVGTQFETARTIMVAEKVEFSYSSDFKVTGVRARERGGDFRELGLESLEESRGLNNSSLFAYFSRIDDILYDIDKSVPISLLDFVRKYHYPSVSITDGPNSVLPGVDFESCADSPLGRTINNAGQSILDIAKDLVMGDSFAQKFAENVCMTDEQILKRNAELRSEEALKEFQQLLQGEMSSVLPMSDPLVQQVMQGIKNISENGPTVFVAWEQLFNKMSFCGLMTLIGRTVEFLAKNAVCGLSPEKALMAALSGALKNMDPRDLKKVFDGIEPPALKRLIQERYFARIAEFLEDIGSSSGLIFPWDYEERLENQTEREEMGLILYNSELFAPDPERATEYSGSLATAFLRGYDHLSYNFPSGSMAEELAAAYWDGYVQYERDAASAFHPAGITPSYNATTGDYELSEEQAQTLVNNVNVTLNRQNGAPVGALVRGLATDTLKFVIEVLVTETLDVLQENLTFEQIISLFEEIPVLGAILKILPKASQCVINSNIGLEEGQSLTFGQLQQNLEQRLGQIDICQLKVAKKPITLPDLEPIMNAKMKTLWASFQNAIIEVLKEVLVSILIRILMSIIRKAIEVILGFVCAATQGNTGEYLRGVLPPELAPGGNMRDFLQGALAIGCGDGEPINPDQRLAELAASLIPGLSQGNALSLMGPQSDCNFVERLQNAVTVAELLDLIEGAASDNTLRRVMRVLETHCTDLAPLLPNEAAISNFFQNLGTIFPSDYIDYLRSTLEDTAPFVGIDGIEPSLCPSLPEALDNLREALNCQENTTPEQIDAYIEQFQDRLAQTAEEMAASLGGAIDSNIGDAIQSALKDLVPKDEPGNLMIADEIVSVLFDPLYSFYARDLMNSIGQGGRPNNAGIINMILANKNGVAQTGQMNNYRAQSGQLFNGAMMGLFAMLPPPFNFLSTATTSPAGGMNLRLTFFGPEPEDELTILDCSEYQPTLATHREDWMDAMGLDGPLSDNADELTDSATGEPLPGPLEEPFNGLGRAEYAQQQRTALRECQRINNSVRLANFGPGPYGFGPLKKPKTIAASLRNLLNDISSHSNATGETLTLYFPLRVSMEYQIRRRPGGRLPFPENSNYFKLSYSFETGLFSFIPYKPRDPEQPPYTALDWSESLTFTSDVSNNLQAELAEYFSELESETPGFGEVNPTNMGAAVLYNNIVRFGTATPSGTPFGNPFSQMRSLAQRLRAGVLTTFSRTIAANSDAFEYGEYNLEILRDNDVLDPPPELLEKGYNFVYLDDGRIFVEPPPKGGWLDIKDRLLPQTDETFCCVDRKELFNVKSIKDRTLEGYKITDDDPRLTINPEIVREPPYARILSRMNLAACEGNVIATIRAYAIEYFLQGYATYNKFPPRSPEVHSDILAEYIAQRMKEGLFNQHNQPGAPMWPPGLPENFQIIPPGIDDDAPDGVRVEKLHAYWYEFLEQCVQTYSRRIKAGQVSASSEVHVAMTNMQEAVNTYIEPDRAMLRSIREAMFGILTALVVTVPLIPFILPQITLKSLRRKFKIDVLRSHEADGMVILKQLIRNELNRISDDLEDIFDAPPGGRIDNVYLDFLRNTYSIGGRNIFNAPVPLDRRYGSSVILPSYEEGEVDPSPFEQNQFMLEGYIHAQGTALSEEDREAFLAALEPIASAWSDEYPVDLLLEAAYLADPENDRIYSIQDMREIFNMLTREGLYDPDTAVTNIFGSFSYGLRLVYALSAAEVTAIEESEEDSVFERMRLDSIFTENREGLFIHTTRSGDEEVPEYGEVTLPIVYSGMLELPYGGSLESFELLASGATSFSVDNVDGFNWNELARLMVETNEFRTLFEYSCPLGSILTLLGIYNAEGFLHSIGGDDDWNLEPGRIRPFRQWNRRIFPVLKRKLKKQFNKIYNSNDIAYIDEESDSDRASREEVERLRLEFSIDWPQWGELTPPVANLLVFTNPMCFAEEHGVEGTPGLSVGPAPSPDAGSPDSPEDTGGSGRDETPGGWEPPDLDLVCCTYTWDATSYASAGSNTEIMLRATAYYMNSDPAYSSVVFEDAPNATWYDLSPGMNEYGTQGVLGYGHQCFEGEHTYTHPRYDDFYNVPGNRGFAQPAPASGDVAVCLTYRRASDMSTTVQRLVYGTPGGSRSVWGSAVGNAYNIAYLNDAAEETIQTLPASECPDIEGG